ncbi:hypothetical protein F2Q68_00031340 [Brassica cretica]|uniref:Uncharacterized protein n=1 Tax=Brassica cretica TaxID=69181 RepID=A0A8S9GBN5_BRACR|nr:hypothetical protein F2Q68_00031340 [Brassica cretica]
MKIDSANFGSHTGPSESMDSSASSLDLTTEVENPSHAVTSVASLSPETYRSLKEISSELTIRGRYEEEAIVRCTSSAVD